MTTGVSLTREQNIAYLQQLQAQKKAQMAQTSATTATASINDSSSLFASDIADNTCTDGCDDGQIDTMSKVGNFLQGIGKTVKNMVTTALQPKNWLKTALTIGVCCIPVVGPAVGAGLACWGIYSGGKQVINAVQLAESATTDAEAKAAWENIGGGTFTVGLSVVGLKGSANALKNQLNGGSTTVNAYRNGETSLEQIIKNGTKETGTNVMKVCKNAFEKAEKIKNKVDEVKTKGVKKSITDAAKNGREWVQENITDKNHTKRDAKSELKQAKETAKANYDAKKAELDSKYGIKEDGTGLSADAQKQYNSELKKLNKELSEARTTARKTYKETINRASVEATERVETYKKALGKNSEAKLSDGSTVKKVKDGYEVVNGNETIKYNKKGKYQSTTVDHSKLKSTKYADGSKRIEASSDNVNGVRDIDKNGNVRVKTKRADGTTTQSVKLDGKKFEISTLDGKTTYQIDGVDVTSGIDKLQCRLATSKFVNEPLTIPGTSITLNPQEGTAILSALNALEYEEE